MNVVLSEVETVSTLAGKGKQVLTEIIFCIEDADHVKYKKSVVCKLANGASCAAIS